MRIFDLPSTAFIGTGISNNNRNAKINQPRINQSRINQLSANTSAKTMGRTPSPIAFNGSFRSPSTALCAKQDKNDGNQKNDALKNGLEKIFSCASPKNDIIGRLFKDTMSAYEKMIDGPSAQEIGFSSILKYAMLSSKLDLFTISYFEGYNLNFKISAEEAASLLPENITPLKLKILDSDEKEQYYLSWYFAEIEAGQSIPRIDLFTYGADQDNKKCLYFLSSVMGVPDWVKGNPVFKKIFEDLMDFLARDSKTGEPSYPHFYTDDIQVTKDGFSVSYEDAKVAIQSSEPIQTNQKLSRDFILANSQIYRNGYDKNVNYFNQDFIDADVEVKDPKLIDLKNIKRFHPLLDADRLQSVQFYGNKEQEIRWYFEMDSAPERPEYN